MLASMAFTGLCLFADRLAAVASAVHGYQLPALETVRGPEKRRASGRFFSLGTANLPVAARPPAFCQLCLAFVCVHQVRRRRQNWVLGDGAWPGSTTSSILESQLGNMRKALRDLSSTYGDMPLTVGETGWASCGTDWAPASSAATEAWTRSSRPLSGRRLTPATAARVALTTQPSRPRCVSETHPLRVRFLRRRLFLPSSFAPSLSLLYFVLFLK